MSRNEEKKGSYFPYFLTAFYAAYVYLNKRMYPRSLKEAGILAAAVIVAYLLLKLVYFFWRRHRLAGASMWKIDRMSGEEFEEYLKLLYEKRGYRVKLTNHTGDFGADLILEKNGERIAIQAKRYRTTVGEAAVQQVISAKAYYDCDKAAVVTNSHFTRAAQKLAEKCDVTLIDRGLLGGKMEIL